MCLYTVPADLKQFKDAEIVKASERKFKFSLVQKIYPNDHMCENFCDKLDEANQAI